MDGLGDLKGGGESVGGRWIAFGCGLEANHGALHALAGGVAEERCIELDLVGGGASQEGFDR